MMKEGRITGRLLIKKSGEESFLAVFVRSNRLAVFIASLGSEFTAHQWPLS